MRGKTMRASKESEGKAEHVLSAFCGGLQTLLGHPPARGKGCEIAAAPRLLERLDLNGKIVTGDAIFWQTSLPRENRRRRRRLCSSAQGQPEEPERRYRNGLQRAGFSPVPLG
ncbi:MAG: hypothetical protein ACREC9_01960 [Methylocella sp.]